ncbi:MAG: hypothetical protein RI601_02645 [Desulfurivibrionaceae bacterium]|nr:hypothetical protein [Desulfurivibrionaceae bacterium]
MEQQIAINMKRLWELVKEGKSAQEIMAEMDISEMDTLKNALQGLMQEKGETINVPGLIGKASVKAEYTDTGKRIPSEMIEDREKK